jgi:hypothetical protein
MNVKSQEVVTLDMRLERLQNTLDDATYEIYGDWKGFKTSKASDDVEKAVNQINSAIKNLNKAREKLKDE